EGRSGLPADALKAAAGRALRRPQTPRRPGRSRDRERRGRADRTLERGGARKVHEADESFGVGRRLPPGAGGVCELVRREVERSENHSSSGASDEKLLRGGVMGSSRSSAAGQTLASGSSARSALEAVLTNVARALAAMRGRRGEQSSNAAPAVGVVARELSLAELTKQGAPPRSALPRLLVVASKQVVG